MVTFPERMQAEHARAARLYLQRQQLEQQRQIIAQQCAQMDLALAKSDGRLEMLEELSKDQT